MLRVIVGALVGGLAGIGVMQLYCLAFSAYSGSPELRSPDIVAALAVGFGSVLGALVGVVDTFKPDRPKGPDA